MQVDREVALSRVGDDWPLLQEVAQLFLDHYGLLLAQIREAIDQRNAAALEMGAHSLKGSVSNFGGAAATAAALVLELRGRKQEWDGVEEDYQALADTLTALRPELEALVSSPEP